MRRCHHLDQGSTFWSTARDVWYAAPQATTSISPRPQSTNIDLRSSESRLAWAADYGNSGRSPTARVVDTPVKPGTIRIILADSQAIYRVGIRKVFALEDDLRVVAQADSLENLRAAIERYPTDIVLLEGSLLAGTANVIPSCCGWPRT
jgi:hypothetical protein